MPGTRRVGAGPPGRPDAVVHAGSVGPAHIHSGTVSAACCVVTPTPRFCHVHVGRTNLLSDVRRLSFATDGHGLSRWTVLELAGVLGVAGAARVGSTRRLEMRTPVGGPHRVGRYRTGEFDGGTEIVAHDARTDRLFVVDSGAGQVEVLDVSDPTTPT